MIKMFFHIQFRGQLRRTRPELIAAIENEVAASACAAGGIVETGRKVFSASFNEDRICFWLDIVILLKDINKVLEKAASELYGCSLVLGRDANEASAQKLSRFYSGRSNREISGIWCQEEIIDCLKFFIVFGRPAKSKRIGAFEGYREIKEFKSFENGRKKHPFIQKIKHALAVESCKNTLLLGPESCGIKEGIYHYCADVLKNVPPIIVRFGAGGRGLVCVADAWTEELKSFVACAAKKTGLENNPDENIKKLDAIYALFFRERFRDEWSPYMMEKGRVFIHSLLSAYIAAAKAEGSKGILLLEDITLADASARILIEVYSSIVITNTKDLNNELLVLGVDSSRGEGIKRWEKIFDRILNLTLEDSVSGEMPELSTSESVDNEEGMQSILEKIPLDLLELSYGASLLGRYFPASIFSQLFEEAGLNRATYLQARHILSGLGLSDLGDPRSLVRDYESIIENILGERIEKIRLLVRSRLLSWAHSDRLYPCFNLLRILSALGEKLDDILTIKSIRADVFNGTFGRIEKAIKKRRFSSIVGAKNALHLEYIYKTLKALVWGEGREIKEAFLEPLPPVEEAADEKPFSGACLAHVEINLASFYIGRRDINAASEAVRKAMLINRDLGEDTIPAHRFFSLMNLSRQRIDDAMEYISFALEQAEKTTLHEEVFLTNYYASSINLLYGNLSKSERLALRAEEAAFKLGQINWGRKARFLRGRLFFEIGRYGEALEIFESIVAGGTINEGAFTESAMAHTIGAWIYRTKNLLGRFSFLEGGAVLAGSDAAIFEIEAAYFSSDYKRAALLAEEYLSSSQLSSQDDYEDDNEVFFFTEQPDWNSGFSQCEYMLQPEKVPGARFARVYQAMAQSALHPSSETKAEILGWMQRFMRDELLPDADPNETIYFYAWYCMLADSKNPSDSKNPADSKKPSYLLNPDMKTSQADLKTIVSMAFKRLQRRAGRIDDMETRQAYLHLPRWNNGLYLAARENKLV